MAKAETTGVVTGVKLQRSPSHLLHRALQHALDIYVEAAGAGAPTQRQFAVLAAVAENEGLTQTDLVRATGIDRSTLADLVARMIGKQLLARERSPTDGRANTVRLTQRGRAALREAAPKVAEADARILDLVPARARDSFLSVLLAFSEASEGDPAAAAAEVAALPAPKTDKKRKKAKAEEPKADKKRKKSKKKG
ncbi:MAG: MarR family transcriptional regulator [Pseudomonadota bacterium]|nr:MarR family transcriptional regulator [Pseudomonadota bacterium]